MIWLTALGAKYQVAFVLIHHELKSAGENDFARGEWIDGLALQVKVAGSVPEGQRDRRQEYPEAHETQLLECQLRS